ncbi:protein FAM227A [Rhinatrema bivittatum]|uniref:protein FAM227A n=1 Tax=Rhinatrema bivittatum TaxID=194408 RepID=UPI001127892A|nr:protein FAM227A [Rhinatrema bivittatum]
MDKLYPLPQDFLDILKVPAVDSAVSAVTKHTTIPVTGGTALKDTQDRKLEVYLKRIFEVSALGMRASICSALAQRAGLRWVQQLLTSQDLPEAEALQADRLEAVMAYGADAFYDLLRVLARSMVAAVSARRLLWLRNWSADASSKTRLGSLPFKERDKKDRRPSLKSESSVKLLDFSKPYSKPDAKKKTLIRPKLVELQRFPGLREGAPTPLPNSASLREVIDNVASAQGKAAGKDLHRFLSTSVVQAILLGGFWWIFLHRYQPEPEIQSLLFEYVAENYVHLLHEAHSFLYGDTLLKIFPSVLSQAVYSCFCFSFPQSWNQFYTEDFRTLICNTFWEWTGGIRPLLGAYSSWNYTSLEPRNMRLEDRMQGKDKTKDFSTSLFGHEGRRNSERCPTTSGRRMKTRNVSSSGMGNKQLSMQPTASGYSLSSLSLHSDLSREAVGLSRLLSLTDSKQVRFSTDLSRTLQMSEMERSRSRKAKSMEMQQPSVRSQKESHPACRGPEFTHNIFNLNSLSPLVQNYLQRQNAVPLTGQDILIQRTEVKNLIPSSMPTYSDLVKQGYRRLQALDNVIRSTYRNRGKESLAFGHSLQEVKDEFLRQEKQFTARNGEMKLNQLAIPVPKVCARRRVPSGFRT